MNRQAVALGPVTNEIVEATWRQQGQMFWHLRSHLALHPKNPSC